MSRPSVVTQDYLNERAAQLRSAILDLAPTQGWPQHMVDACMDALDDLDFRRLDGLLARMDNGRL